MLGGVARLFLAAGVVPAAGRLPDDPGPTQLPGANPETMSSSSPRRSSAQFGQIPSLASMTSTSSFGISQITLQFDLERDIDAAAQDVQAAINAAGSTLPRNLPYPPTYSKVNPADAPIMTLALTSDTCRCASLSDIADTLLAQRSSRSGRRSRLGPGRHQPAVRIRPTSRGSPRYGLGIDDSNASPPPTSPARRARSTARNSPTPSPPTTRSTTAEAYRDVVIAYRNGAPVLPQRRRRCRRRPGEHKVGGWYQRQARGHPRHPAPAGRQRRRDRGCASRPNCRGWTHDPAGVKLDDGHDRTDTIRASIHDVKFTLVLSVGLVVLVVLLFLRTCERRSSPASRCRCR